MKSIIQYLCVLSILALFAGCDICLFCQTTGYGVIINAGKMYEDDLDHVEFLLIDNGYEALFEKYNQHENNIEKKYRFLVKKELNEVAGSVMVYVLFNKNTNELIDVKIVVSNWFVGLVDNEIHDEIDVISEKIYRYLVEILGDSCVEIERREWGPPVTGYKPPTGS